MASLPQVVLVKAYYCFRLHVRQEYLLRQCVHVRTLSSQMRHTRQQPLDNQLKQRLIENKEKEGVAGGSIRILLVPDVREE